jgi:hypothetical protein
VNSPADEELFPGGFDHPVSIFLSGPNSTLLKWVAYASLAPYSTRVFWTDARLPGEVLDPLDPLQLQVVPEEAVHVLHPRELQPNELEAMMGQAATATVIRSDETPEAMRKLVEFLRMPTHTQQRVTAIYRRDEPAIIVAANAHRLAPFYSVEQVAPYLQAIKDSGASVVSLWSDAPTIYESLFDIILHVEGSACLHEWRKATIQCLKGLPGGPLAGGKTHALEELPPISEVLGPHLPMTS